MHTDMFIDVHTCMKGEMHTYRHAYTPSHAFAAGQATLTDIELNEEFIQEVAMVPTNLLIKGTVRGALARYIYIYI